MKITKYSWMAVACLICGIVSSLWFYLSILGSISLMHDLNFRTLILGILLILTIVFGIVGLIQVKNKKLRGKEMIILGFILVVLEIIFFILSMLPPPVMID